MNGNAVMEVMSETFANIYEGKSENKVPYFIATK
jgi:hypothetical protein